MGRLVGSCDRSTVGWRVFSRLVGAAVALMMIVVVGARNVGNAVGLKLGSTEDEFPITVELLIPETSIEGPNVS